MNWFTRLFQRKPQPRPELRDTIYQRGNRWFPFPSTKWADQGWSQREAMDIFVTASKHCDMLNYHVTKPLDLPTPTAPPYPSAKGLSAEVIVPPRPKTAPVPDVPPPEDTGLTNFLIAEELSTIAADSVTAPTPTPDPPAFSGDGGSFGGAGASGGWDPPDSSFSADTASPSSTDP